MKRAASMLVLLLMISIILVPMHGYAAECDADAIYFDDGSRIVITLQILQPRASGTKTASKTYSYVNGNGVEEWRAVLTGTFSYTGTSAMCTSSSCNVTIYESAWYEISKMAGKSGGTATADLTMGLKYLGITTKKVPVKMTLTCDANGNLS